MADKLKSCPSGNQEEHHVYKAHWEEGAELAVQSEVAQIRCDCGFQGPLRYGNNCIAEAISAWNTRASQSRIEELERENAELKENLEVCESKRKTFSDNMVPAFNTSQHHRSELIEQVKSLQEQLSEANAKLAATIDSLLLNFPDYLLPYVHDQLKKALDKYRQESTK